MSKTKKTNKDVLRFKISGPAGSGILQLGEILATAFGKTGYYVLVYPEYPSRIRGGDNNIQVVISIKGTCSPGKKVDFVLAMNNSLGSAHLDDLAEGGEILSADDLKLDEVEPTKSSPIVKNAFMAGLAWKICGQDVSILLSTIKKALNGKLVDENLKAARLGFAHDAKIQFSLKKIKSKIAHGTGNQVFASSCELAGVEYACIYPMTPVTSLLAYLAKTKIKMLVPEDEIFAAISTLGASYAGKRALTATSGGGFCLMTEAIGFAAMAEIPLVVILGQRSGPSSGMATYSSQADLDFAINCSHGEIQRIVLAPGDLLEIKELTQEAFNLSDQYQVPVIILTDKFLSESIFSVPLRAFDKIKVKINRGKRIHSKKDYLRYVNLPDGISPRAFPGETTFQTNSYEHDEYGFSADDTLTRVLMSQKRFRKINDLPGGYRVIGNRNASKVVVGWGSTKMILTEFVQENSQFKYIHINRPWPLAQKIAKELHRAKQITVVENNSTGQMARIIESECNLEVKTLLKDDGRPFFKEDLEKLKKL